MKKVLFVVFVCLSLVAFAADPEQEKKEAEEMLRLAEQGIASAQYQLGVMYNWGKGVPEDNKEAAKWLLKAAEQGHDNAQVNIGYFYIQGKGVPKDFSAGMDWLLKAAEQGKDEAMANIAAMYHKGEGVTRNEAMAYMWFILAGNRKQQYVASREYLEKTLPAEQLEEGKRLADEWLAKHPPKE